MALPQRSAIGAHQRLEAAMPVGQVAAGGNQPSFHQQAKGHALGLSPRGQSKRGRFRQRFHGGDAPSCRFGIDGIALDADEAPPEALGHRRRRAAAEEGIQHHLPRQGAREDDAVQQRFRLLCRVQLLAVPALSSRSRSAPVQSGMNQSLRICTSSFSAFIAA